MVNRYDGAEINICVELDCHDGTTTMEAGYTEEEAQEAVDAGEAFGWVYSVYWHLKEGGVEHVADFPPTDEGKRRAEALYAALLDAASGEKPR